MFTGTMSEPTSGLNMDQLNEILGGFKTDLMSSFDQKLSSFTPPAYEPTDYSGQFGGLEDKIAGIERQLSSLPGPTAIDYSKISSLVSDQVNGAISGIQMPSYEAPDLNPIYDQLGQINSRFDNLPQAPGIDYGKIDSLIGNKISSLDIPTYEAPDLSGITNRLDQLDQRFGSLPEPTAVDLSPITGQIEDLKLQIGGMQPQPVDFSVLDDRFSAINNRFDNMPTTDLSGIQSQLDGLNEKVGGFNVDLSPLTGQIDSLKSQFDGFMSDNKADGPAFAQIDPAVMEQLTNANNDRFGSIAADIQGLGSRLDQINAAQQNMGPGLTEGQLDQRLSMIDDRFGSFDQRLNDALNREDPFVTALNSIQNGDYQFNIGDQNYDFSNLFPHVDSIAPGRGNGGFNGDAPGGYSPPGGGYTPPANPAPVTPPPSVNPAQPPEVTDGIDWNRYGRDYGEVDFNVGGTAGNAPAVQPGAGGVNLQDLFANLGL